MSLLPSATEFAINREPRAACVLLLDRSSSMSGESIDELNQGLRLLHEALLEDEMARNRVEIMVYSFGGNVTLENDFQAASDWIPPVLSANGDTPMAEALKLGMRAIEDRKLAYKAGDVGYFRPWIWLITDGGPNGEPWEPQAEAVRKGDREGKFVFFAVGVRGADFGVLRRIAPDERPPRQIDSSEFQSMFEWLSKSLQALSRSGTPTPGSNGSGSQMSITPPGWGSIPT